MPSSSVSHPSSLSTRNSPVSHPARTPHPASASPRCCSFPLISRSSHSAPRAPRQTKHQKPRLGGAGRKPAHAGLSHDPTAPSQHPRERDQVSRDARSHRPLTSWGTKVLVHHHHRILFVLINKTRLVRFFHEVGVGKAGFASLVREESPCCP